MQDIYVPSIQKKTRVFHADLTKLGRKFGYPFTDGLCYGFSMMMAQALFANDINTILITWYYLIKTIIPDYGYLHS